MNHNTMKAVRLLIFSIITIFGFGLIAYKLENKKYKKDNKTDENLPFFEFINGQKKMPPLPVIIYGMVFGLIFGFIDNFFIFIGIDSLEHLMPDNDLIKAGLGNTYSDVIGAIVGTFIASISQLYFDYEDEIIPMWVNTVGIFFGCLLGLYIPLFIKRLFS